MHIYIYIYVCIYIYIYIYIITGPLAGAADRGALGAVAGGESLHGGRAAAAAGYVCIYKYV